MKIPPIRPELLVPIITDMMDAAHNNDTHEESARALADLLADEVEVRVNLWRTAAHGVNEEFATETDNAVKRALGVE